MKENDVFPDYVPKTTPDTVYDYLKNPEKEIFKILEEIGDPELQKLKDMLNLFKKYKKSAKSNPGHLENGRVGLGANIKQYVPSDEELMESEIGERIGLIVFKTNPQEIESILKEVAIMLTQIEYKKIEFRHVDVMGSGRFFYASEPFSVTIKFR